MSASSKLLVLNAGSSSLKFKVFGLQPFAAGIGGMFDRIGDAVNCTLKASTPADPEGGKGRKWELKIPAKDHVGAMQSILDFIKDNVSSSFAREVVAVGHRVVHGLEISQPVLLTDETIGRIREASVLAPLHNPPGLQGIDAAEKVFKGVPQVRSPSLYPQRESGIDFFLLRTSKSSRNPSRPSVALAPQVAVFDTAFHQTMPSHAFMYGLPYELYEKHKIRRYGFHGTSHKYLVEQAAGMLGKPVLETNVITCHLGNGSSIAAIRGGQCIDTTMGMTPLEGLLMGTRCGDLDPAVVLFIQKQLNLSVQDTDTLMNKKSGLLGLTGSNDLRAVIEGAQRGEPRSELGLAMFVYRVQKYIGAYWAALGGKVDAVVFSAGIGENSSIIRGLILGPLKGMGLELDVATNNATVGGRCGDIAAASSRCRLLVIPTDEELCIAEQTLEVVGFPKPTGATAA